MSKNSWISKEDYCTIFHLVKSGTPNDEIAQLTRKSQRTIKRARNYLNRAYSGTLSPDAADRENQNLRIWALDFARKHPITDIQAHPQVSAKSDAIDPDDVLALFLAQFFTEVFFLAANNTSFRMDWLDLLAVQGTLKSLLQHHSSKHQFFGAQLSS